ncbi:hypothetical protein ACQ4M4_07675 [Leptolyngbya sp. AN02str]|uniref:hypothetical protein n=1 Tax=Leptolyngbya sp. AN02str TaxID=3423363 RepID=UPI003D31643D
MQRIIRHGMWVVIGVVVVVVFAVMGKIGASSPAALEGGIASVRLGEPSTAAVTAILPGRAFTCTLGDTVDECTTTVDGRSLVVMVRYPSRERVMFAPNVACEATYSGTPVGCEAYYDYGPGAIPMIGLNSDLGLSRDQMQALRSTYPLEQSGEAGWFRLVQQVAIASAILACITAWLNTHQQLNAITRLNAGIVTATIGYGAFMVLLLRYAGLLGWYDTTPVRTMLAIAVGVAFSAVLGGFFAWNLRGHGNRAIAGLSSGLGAVLVLLGVSLVTQFTWLSNVMIPFGPLVAAVVSIGCAVAALVWWRPLMLGRVFAGFNLGLFVYCGLFYSFVLLMLGSGLVD